MLELSLDQREAIAQSVISGLLPMLNPSGQIDGKEAFQSRSTLLTPIWLAAQALTYTQTANLQCVVALHDLLVANTANNIAKDIGSIQKKFPGFYSVK